jgi:hypothetical protein
MWRKIDEKDYRVQKLCLYLFIFFFWSRMDFNSYPKKKKKIDDEKFE